MSALSAKAGPVSRSGRWIACLVLLAGCSATGSWSGVVPPELSHPVREAPFDVEHYSLEIDLDPVAQRISGRARVRLGARAKALNEIQLDFVDLKVRAVEGEHGEPLKFTHEDGLLAIQLAHGLRPGDFTEFSVLYDGSPRRGLYFTDVENGVATQVFTQGECEDSRGWFPCFDFPNDRATSEVAVTMPANWTSVAAGERVERRELEHGRALERWRMSTPHPAYLTTLVAGNFTMQVGEWDGIPLVYLADPKLEPFMAARFAQTPKVLEFLSKLTGVRYPYPKYSQAAVSNFQFGGMENISATTLTDTWLTDERGDRDSPAAGLIAHEAAHQWFGDLLTCRDWAHIWLNEGWATYANELYTEASEGPEAFEISMAAVRNGYLDQDVGSARRPMISDSYRDPMDLFVTGHAYPGGASRLHQLRFELGDEKFFAGVRRYFAEHRGTSVTTEDFQHSLETASGRNLSKFFKQWFYSKGYPEFAMSWNWDESKHKLIVQIEQVQTFADGTLEVFRTPAEIEIMPGRGESAEPRLERIAIEKRKSSFTFDAAQRPRWVLFDPHGWLVARSASERSSSEWLQIAEGSTHPLVRSEALGVLARLAREGKDDRAHAMYVQVIEGRLAEDPQPSVRVSASRALAALAPAFGRTALQNAAAGDADSGVRVAALEGLVGFAPDERLAAFAREQYDACFSWSSMAAAAALGAQAKPQQAFEILTAQFKLSSPHDVLLSALITSLAGVNDDRVVGELDRIAFAGEFSARARQAAVRGLGRAAHARPDIRVQIEALLGDPDYRLRGAAIEALQNFQDPQALPALRRAYPKLVDSRQRRAVEAIVRAPWALTH